MYFSLFGGLVGDVGTQHQIRDRLISFLLNPFWLRCLYTPALCWLRLFVCYFEVSILYLNAMSKQEHNHHTKNYNAGKLKNNTTQTWRTVCGRSLLATIRKFNFFETLLFGSILKEKHEKANESLLTTYTDHGVILKTAQLKQSLWV